MRLGSRIAGVDPTHTSVLDNSLLGITRGVLKPAAGEFEAEIVCEFVIEP